MWPFTRRRPKGSTAGARPGPQQAPAPAPPAEPVGPAGLPPLQRSLEPLQASGLVAGLTTFSDDLATWQNPARTHEPLGHEVRADAPAGLAQGVARAGAPISRTTDTPMPVAQRTRRPAAGGSRRPSWPATEPSVPVQQSAAGAPSVPGAPEPDAAMTVQAPAAGETSTLSAVAPEVTPRRLPTGPATVQRSVVTAARPADLPVRRLPTVAPPATTAAPRPPVSGAPPPPGAAEPVSSPVSGPAPAETNAGGAAPHATVEPAAGGTPDVGSSTVQRSTPVDGAPSSGTLQPLRPVSTPPSEPGHVQRSADGPTPPALPVARPGGATPGRRLGLGPPVSSAPRVETTPGAPPPPGSPLAASTEAAKAFLASARPTSDPADAASGTGDGPTVQRSTDTPPAVPADPPVADVAADSTPPAGTADPPADGGAPTSTAPLGEVPPGAAGAPLVGERPLGSSLPGHDPTTEADAGSPAPTPELPVARPGLPGPATGAVLPAVQRSTAGPAPTPAPPADATAAPPTDHTPVQPAEAVAASSGGVPASQDRRAAAPSTDAAPAAAPPGDTPATAPLLGAVEPLVTEPDAPQPDQTVDAAAGSLELPVAARAPLVGDGPPLATPPSREPAPDTSVQRAAAPPASLPMAPPATGLVPPPAVPVQPTVRGPAEPIQRTVHGPPAGPVQRTVQGPSLERLTAAPPPGLVRGDGAGLPVASPSRPEGEPPSPGARPPVQRTLSGPTAGGDLRQGPGAGPGRKAAVLPPVMHAPLVHRTPIAPLSLQRSLGGASAPAPQTPAGGLQTAVPPLHGDPAASPARGTGTDAVPLRFPTNGAVPGTGVGLQRMAAAASPPGTSPPAVPVGAPARPASAGPSALIPSTAPPVHAGVAAPSPQAGSLAPTAVQRLLTASQATPAPLHANGRPAPVALAANGFPSHALAGPDRHPAGLLPVARAVRADAGIRTAGGVLASQTVDSDGSASPTVGLSSNGHEGVNGNGMVVQRAEVGTVTSNVAPDTSTSSADLPQEETSVMDSLDLDLLTRRIGDRLITRVKRELRIDRERMGRPSDIRR